MKRALPYLIIGVFFIAGCGSSKPSGGGDPVKGKATLVLFGYDTCHNCHAAFPAIRDILNSKTTTEEKQRLNVVLYVESDNGLDTPTVDQANRYRDSVYPGAEARVDERYKMYKETVVNQPSHSMPAGALKDGSGKTVTVFQPTNFDANKVASEVLAQLR